MNRKEKIHALSEVIEDIENGNFNYVLSTVKNARTILSKKLFLVALGVLSLCSGFFLIVMAFLQRYGKLAFDGGLIILLSFVIYFVLKFNDQKVDDILNDHRNNYTRS